MKITLLVLDIFVIVFVNPEQDKAIDFYEINQDVRKLKNLATWEIKNNFADVKSINGYFEDFVSGKESLYKFDDGILELEHKSYDTPPLFFDARKKWPKCTKVISHLRRINTNCPPFWSQALAAVISDRICIESDGKTQVLVSARDILECGSGCEHCDSDSSACLQASPNKAWQFWITSGVVTNSCVPYTNVGANCVKNCTNASYALSYEEDKHYGGFIYKMPIDEEQIALEIMHNGPVTATFRIYEDFFFYGQGVYQRVSDRFFGYHVVKILGWGVEEGEKFWLCANNWTPDWGLLGGYFKIRKGKNHCGIENNVRAGRINKNLNDEIESIAKENCSMKQLLHIYILLCIFIARLL